MPLRHYLQLALTEGIGPILMGRLIEALGSAQGAVGATTGDLRSIEGIGVAKAQGIHSALRMAEYSAWKGSLYDPRPPLLPRSTSGRL